MSSDPSARRTQRVNVNLKVNLKFQDRETFEQRFAQNISKNGLFIRAKDPVPVGSRVKFEYLLADQSRVMRGVGIVRWIRTAAEAQEPDSPPGMGIEFVDIDQETELLISQIIARRGEGERAPKRAKASGATPVALRPHEGTAAAPALEPDEESALSALVGPSAAQPDRNEGAPSSDEAAAPPPIEIAPPTASGAFAQEHPPVADELDQELDGAFAGNTDRASAHEAAPPAAAAENTPVETTATENAPVETTATENASLEMPATENASLETTATENASAETTPAENAPAETTAADNAPADPPPAEPMPSAGDDFVAAAAARAARTEQAPIAEAAAPVAAPLLVDLCSADLLTTLGSASGPHERRTLATRFGFVNEGLALTDDGVLLPHLISWLGPSWPTPKDRARARRLGVGVRSDSPRPAVEHRGKVIDLAQALDLALRTAVGRPGERAVGVLIPSTASRQARAAVRESLKKAGAVNVVLLDDAVCALRGAGLEIAPGAHVVVVQLCRYETRAALIEGPDTLVAAASSPDPCLADADDAAATLAIPQFLRDHQIDVMADAGLKSDLTQQIAESRRIGANWRLSLAGKEIELDVHAVELAVAPLSERLIAMCSTILEARQLDAKALHTVVLVADEPAWPGLSQTVQQQLGSELSQPTPDPFIRVVSAARAPELEPE